MLFDKKRVDVKFEYDPWANISFCLISIIWACFSQKTAKF